MSESEQQTHEEKYPNLLAFQKARSDFQITYPTEANRLLNPSGTIVITEAITAAMEHFQNDPNLPIGELIDSTIERLRNSPDELVAETLSLELTDSVQDAIEILSNQIPEDLMAPLTTFEDTPEVAVFLAQYKDISPSSVIPPDKIVDLIRQLARHRLSIRVGVDFLHKLKEVERQIEQLPKAVANLIDLQSQST